MNKRFLALSLPVFIVFAGVHSWNSTHSLSLEFRTEQLGLKQEFGFYQVEKADDRQEFQWTSDHAGTTLRIEKPVMTIPILASHPGIKKNPIRVKVYAIKDFFNERRLLGEIIIRESKWKTYSFSVSEEINEEIILLFKVNRTWNPQKTKGMPDPRNLGVAVGQIQFEDDSG